MPKYCSNEENESYFPPILSNGEISFAPDAEGMLGYTFDEYKKKGIHAFDGIVVRAARRSAVCRNMNARLFPFGKFVFFEGSELLQWSQVLKTEEGCFESDCLYQSGARIHSKGFIHPSLNLYALEKVFHNVGTSRKVSYEVKLCGYNEIIQRYMNVTYVKKEGHACVIGFKMYGLDVYTGELRFFVDEDFTASYSDDAIRICFDVENEKKVSFYYYLEDDLHGVDYLEALRDIEKRIDETGFDGLRDQCAKHFEEYSNFGYVNSSDETLNEIYKTSLYSIKSNTTKYSVAVGLNNGSWDGRYFAFDEYTSFLGLLGANRSALAKRVPWYRLHICLPSAIQRASDSHRNEKTEDMARFHWESGEFGNSELSPDGHWQDHIFHIPLVGLGAFHYYEYTLDMDFLTECYPMIRACSKYITKHMVYHDGDRLYIGKCTDLERLGSSVQNAFMSTCGAIKLLECCKKAADILNVDHEYSKECAIVAEKLSLSLPNENGRYVPYPACDQKSIAVFAGKFPFDVLDDDDQKMLAAWSDFEANGAAYGNMYPVGKSISPWYACWKAISYARVGYRDEAYRALKQAYASAGVFYDLFEINEKNHRMRPWFATAAGIYVCCVNDMLVQSNGNTITVMPGLPHDIDVSFKLAVRGGAVVEAEVKNGALVRLSVLKNGEDVTNRFEIEF